MRAAMKAAGTGCATTWFLRLLLLLACTDPVSAFTNSKPTLAPSPRTTSSSSSSSSSSPPPSSKLQSWTKVFGSGGPETFDQIPLLAQYVDVGERGTKWFQNAEIKNGRVAMVATIGYLIQKFGIHFPIYFAPTSSEDTWYLSQSAGITFADVSHASGPFEALAMVPPLGWAQILSAAAAFELTAWNRQWNENRGVPGDYGFDPLGFTRDKGVDHADFEALRLQEIKHGRLAMITMAGWISEECIPGSFPVWHP